MDGDGTMSCSYININSAKLTEMCWARIEKIQAERLAERQRILDEERAEQKKSWWYRLFGGAELTDEEIVGRYRQSLCDPFWWAGRWKEESMMLAYKLLTACEYADTISVSVEDFDKIS